MSPKEHSNSLTADSEEKKSDELSEKIFQNVFKIFI
jgi:hypothetical protein